MKKYLFFLLCLHYCQQLLAWNTPSISSPAPGANAWTGITFDWNAVSNSQFYQIQLDTSATFGSPVSQSYFTTYINSASGNSDTQYYLENLFFGKTYFWRVRAGVTGDTSAWSTRSFTTYDLVSLSTPAHNSSQWTGLVFDWSAHTGVDFYDIELDTTNQFNSTVKQSGSTTYINSASGNSDTQYYFEDLFFGKTYYWRVRARNAVDTSAWSTRSFTTYDLVSLSTPAHNSSQWTGLVFDWSAHTGVDFYDIELDSTNLFNSTVKQSGSTAYINSASGNSDTQYSFENLFFGKTYYWRVRARNAVDTSAWSTRAFTTYDLVSLSTPAHNSSQWTGLVFDWSAHTGVDFYDIELDTTNQFNSTVKQSGSTTYINSASGNSDTQYYFEDLFFGKTYYWRVRARNAVDTSAWSTRSFTTYDLVSLSTPAHNSSQWTGLVFDWSAHTGVDFYDIELDSTNLFNSTVKQSGSTTYINSASGNSDTQYYFEDLFFGKTYYWRVRARNAVDTSTWSTRSFTTRDYVSLQSPSNNSVNIPTSGYTLDWSAHTGINIYQLQIDTTALFNSPILITANKNYINSASGNSDTESGTGILLSNHLYYWRVRAINAIDTSEWTTRVFNTGSCIPPAQPGPINGSGATCQATTQTYSISPVAGAVSYIWSLPSGWSGSSATISLLATTGNSGGIISVQAINSCGSSSPATISVNTSPLPAVPGAISGSTSLCQGTGATTYTVAPVSGATSYIWTFPSGFSGNSNSNSITVLVSSTAESGTISVKSVNSCGNSSESFLAVSVDPLPDLPGSINGLTEVCEASGNQVYSIVTLPNALTYNWNVPAGWTIVSGNGGTSATVTPGLSGQNGNITVTAQNTCGNSSASTLPVIVSGTIATTGSISGNATPCSQASDLIYSIDPVSGANQYNWTVPAGWSIISGDGSTTIHVNAGNTGQNGTINVTPVNNCATGTTSAFNVAVSGSVPNVPGAISGNSEVCASSSNEVYQIAPVNGADSYSWNLPAGWQLLSGNGTTSIVADPGTIGQNGTISVVAVNTCGTGPATTLAVTVPDNLPGGIGPINGTNTLCSGASPIVYSISPASNATDYVWSIPAGWTILSGNGTTTISVQPGAAGGIISVYGENNCGTGTPSELSVTVSNAPANPGTPFGNISLCPGSETEIYSVSSVAGAASYNWTIPSGWTFDGNSNGPIITVSASTTAESGIISVTAVNSCGQSAAGQLTVTVKPLPVINAGNDTLICIQDFPATLEVTGNATNYEWSTGETGTSIQILIGGDYFVTGTLNGCQTTDDISVTEDLCLGLTEQEFTFNLYPNPATDWLVVYTVTEKPEEFTLLTTDGRIVFRGILQNGKNIVSLSSLATGPYFLRSGMHCKQLEIVH